MVLPVFREVYGYGPELLIRIQSETCEISYGAEEYESMYDFSSITVNVITLGL